ncbi:MAG: hypothetical protein ACRDF0_06170 [Candidatus Limnocylindria bacterium]
MPRARALRHDGTTACEECGMPMFPYARTAGLVRLECANHHHAQAAAPREAGLLRAIDNWVAKRGAQLHAQHERWGTDDEEERDERDPPGAG